MQYYIFMELDLQNIGFSDKEARVYRALLEHGSLNVAEIAKLAEINRTSGYHILSSLIKKGLVGMTKKQKRVLYAAEDPGILSRYVSERVQEWQVKLGEVNESIPELRTLYQEPITKPRVRYHENMEGLKAIYEDSLLCREKEIRAYASTEHLKNVLGESYAEDYFKRRTEKRIFIRSIIPTSPYGIKLKRIQKEYLRKIHLMPLQKYSISPEIYIYDNKVAYISLQEKFGVVVESKEIAEAEKRIYELAWEASKPYDIQEELKLKREQGRRSGVSNFQNKK